MDTSTGRIAPGWARTRGAVPEGGDLLGRPRLLARLGEAVGRGGAALVVAPGGTGKSSLLASWAAGAWVPVAWYALDTADRDPRRLLEGLARSVGQAGIDTTPVLAALEAGVAPAAALGPLLGLLGDGALALVLDDLQHLDGAGEAAALLEHLARRRPPGLSLVLASRTVPSPGLTALLAPGGVLGLGVEDLAFGREEAGALLLAHGLEPGEGAALAGRSGGWAAGILLLARAHAPRARFLRAHHEAVFEQLAGEILGGLPPDLRQFVLESAALGPATAAEADRALGRADSAARYEDALARGLFLEDGGGTYRYHDLFRDWLGVRLRAERPERLAAIARAAADAALASGDIPRALAQLGDAREWAALARTVEEQGRALLISGHYETILQRLQRLPAPYLSPRLRVLEGFVHLELGAHAEAVRIADAALASRDDPSLWLRATLLRLGADVFDGPEGETLAAVDAALEVAASGPFDEQATSLREIRAVAQLRSGNLADGRAALLAALAAHERAGEEHSANRVAHNLGLALLEAGRIEEARGYLERAERHYTDAGNIFIRGDFAVARVRFAALEGDTAQALAHARRCVEVADSSGHPVYACDARVALAGALLEAGTLPEAGEVAAEAARMAERLELPRVSAAVDRARIAVAIARRERGPARELIDRGRARGLGPVDAALLDALDGRLALRSGAFARAEVLLGAAVGRLDALSRPHEAARALLLLAEATLASGSRTRAEAHLTRLAEVAAAGGYEGYLRPVAYLARRCLAGRRGMRRLTTAGRALLDALAASEGTDEQGTAARRAPGKGGRAAEGPPEPPLRLSPFGEGRAWHLGVPLDLALLTPRAREVLFFAGRERRPLPRATLLAAVWDDAAGAGTGLWNASRHLRRVLGEGSWLAEGGTYRLGLAARDDEALFLGLAATALGEGEAAARLAAAEEALALTEDGGYLEWCESGWAVERRAACAALAARLGGAAGRLYAAQGQAGRAVAACERACAADPLDEEAWIALCEVLLALGRRAEAVAAYRRYRDLLDRELGTAPGPALRRVFRADSP